eukprot:4156929-Prymnesium_polylepis.1
MLFFAYVDEKTNPDDVRPALATSSAIGHVRPAVKVSTPAQARTTRHGRSDLRCVFFGST